MSHKPRITTESNSDRMAPDCPHCGADMENATTTLGSIMEAGEIAHYVPVDEDGYASGTWHPRLTCPSCSRESVLARDIVEVKLIAARSPLDQRMLRGEA